MKTIFPFVEKLEKVGIFLIDRSYHVDSANRSTVISLTFQYGRSVFDKHPNFLPTSFANTIFKLAMGSCNIPYTRHYTDVSSEEEEWVIIEHNTTTYYPDKFDLKIKLKLLEDTKKLEFPPFHPVFHPTDQPATKIEKEIARKWSFKQRQQQRRNKAPWRS